MNSINTDNAEHYVWGEVCEGWHLVKREEISVIQERVPPGRAEVKHLHSRARQFFFILEGRAAIEIGEAVDSPRRLTDDPACARRLLDLVPSLPTPVWGRDELATGEMWNSNSVISWLIASSGLNPDSIQPPAGGRAPGWKAGLVVARRLAAQHHPA